MRGKAIEPHGYQSSVSDLFNRSGEHDARRHRLRYLELLTIIVRSSMVTLCFGRPDVPLLHLEVRYLDKRESGESPTIKTTRAKILFLLNPCLNGSTTQKTHSIHLYLLQSPFAPHPSTSFQYTLSLENMADDAQVGSLLSHSCAGLAET